MAFVPDSPPAAQPRFVPDAAPAAPAGPATNSSDFDVLDRESPVAVDTPQESAGGVAGLGEGAKRFWGGMKQLGGGLEDAFNLFFYGQKTNNAAQVTAAENARQAAAQASQPPGAQRGAFGAGAQIAQTALSAAPALATEGLAGPATTFAGNLARQAAVGGATGGLAFSPTDDHATNALFGAALGATVAVPAAAIPAARNVVANAIRATAGRSEGAYQAAKGVMDWGGATAAASGGEPTLAMRTGAPVARSLEAQTFNSRLQERYQKISDYFATRFKSVFNLPDTPAPALDDQFTQARQSASTAITGMRRAASDAYNEGMAKAGSMADQVSYSGQPATGPTTFTQGGAPSAPGQPQYGTVPQVGARVRAGNFAARLNAVSAADSDPIGGSQVLPSDWVKAVQAKLANGNGQLSVKDTAGVLRRLSSFMGDDQPVELRALAHQLRDSFNTDLDLIERDASGAHPAVQQVLATRAAYRGAQQRIETLQQSAAYRFLGLGPTEQQVDPATLLARYSAFTPAKQTEIANYLRQNTPQLLQQMRAKVLSDTAAVGLHNAAPAASTETDPGAMVDTLFGNGQTLKTSGLWNKDELAKFEGFRQAMRVLNNVAARGTTGAGTVVGPADVAPNVISRSPIFIARQLARVATLGKGDLIFSSPTAVNYWTKIRSTSGPTQTAAIVGYANYLSGLAQPNGQGQAAR